MYRTKICLLFFFLLLPPLVSWSQSEQYRNSTKDPFEAQPVDRILLPADDTQRTVLLRNVHPWAKLENMVGEVPSGQPMECMVLVLRPDPAQEEALEELIRAQQDPASAYYHRWLSPESYGEHFGVSQSDLAQVSQWLEVHGMKVNEIPVSRRAVVFSGTAGQVEATFHTQMRRYFVLGQPHFANATNPEIPQALASIVKGIVSLHDFRSAPAHTAVPAYTLANGVNLLMPKDWDTIYDVNPLSSQSVDGTGQSIAVVGRTDLALRDCQEISRASVGSCVLYWW